MQTHQGDIKILVVARLAVDTFGIDDTSHLTYGGSVPFGGPGTGRDILDGRSDPDLGMTFVTHKGVVTRIACLLHKHLGAGEQRDVESIFITIPGIAVSILAAIGIVGSTVKIVCAFRAVDGGV